MLKKLLGKFSTISIKLFLSFWLIIAMTIITTRIISMQFIEESKNIPPQNADFRKLIKILNKSSIDNIDALTQLTSKSIKKGANSNRWTVVAKNLSTNGIYHAQDKKIKHIIDYIEQTHFTHKTSVQFTFNRLTGPVITTIADVQYQLFIIQKSRRLHWTTYLRELPPWVHIGTAMLISFLICWLLARSFSKPITHLKHASAEFGNGKLASRVTQADKRNDELGDLARSFNQMAEKLEHNIGAQQRLLADVSHELRTPLTRLQIAVGLAQQEDISQEKLNQYLSRCEKEVVRLDQMIADVLTLSRLENTVKTINLEKTEMNTFINQIVNDCQFIADEKHINIVFNPTSTLSLPIDTKLLNSALSNILNNAIKYSAEETRIDISVSQTNHHAIITLTDHGPGVAEDELEHIFTPFYRASHVRGKDGTGTGLGLAITKQAIDLHGGEITAKNADNAGLIVQIKLPKES